MLINEFTYKGITYKSKHSFEVISEEEFKYIRDTWRAKPDFEDVKYQIFTFSKGKNTFNKIVKYYYNDLMEETKKYSDKWSVADIFDCKEMLSLVLHKITLNKKVFHSNDIFKNIGVALSLSGKGMATKISNFPIATCDYILSKYNTNGVYYDYSCGWGVRLACSLRQGISYYGTDPNYRLVERLNSFYNDYSSMVGNSTKATIYCQGSQEFIPELENKVGVAFSSPPYFNLEDYKYGNQSYVSGETTYEEWVESYLRPTFKNIYKYLITNGYFIINIKNFDNIPLEETTKKVAEECGFKLHTIEQLNQVSRTVSVGEYKGDYQMSSSENIYVFVKQEFENGEHSLFGFEEIVDEPTRHSLAKKEFKNKSNKSKKDNFKTESLW